MNIEVKPLHFPFHSEVDLNPTKCKLFCNVSHCINFNARLTSPYAFTRCIHHQDIAPHQVSIRHMSWGPPGVLQPSNSKCCRLGNVAGRTPDAWSCTRIYGVRVITEKGWKEKPLSYTFINDPDFFWGAGSCRAVGPAVVGCCQLCLWAKQVKCPI